MSALIENGWTYQSHNTPAWHGAGTTFPDAADPEAAWLATGGHIIAEGEMQGVLPGCDPIKSTRQKLLYRVGPHGDITELGTVGVGYTVVQPRDITHKWDDLIESGLVELETGGWLSNGIFWSQARVKPAITEVVTNDIIQGRFLLTAGFDGKNGIDMGDHKERAVCANTIAIAKAQFKHINIKLKHTSGVHDRLNQATMLVEAYIKAFTEETAVYKQLAGMKLTAKTMKDYFWKVFAPDADTDAKRNAHPRIKSKVSHVMDLLDAPEYEPAVLGSAWHCYNAVSHFVSHDIDKDPNARLTSLWYGSGADLNQRAMNNAVALLN